MFRPHESFSRNREDSLKNSFESYDRFRSPSWVVVIVGRVPIHLTSETMPYSILSLLSVSANHLHQITRLFCDCCFPSSCWLRILIATFGPQRGGSVLRARAGSCGSWQCPVSRMEMRTSSAIFGTQHRRFGVCSSRGNAQFVGCLMVCCHSPMSVATDQSSVFRPN